MNRPDRQVLLKRLWIICGKGNLVEKEVVADEDCRSHRFGRHHCRLCYAVREDPDEHDCRANAFNPSPNPSFHSVPHYECFFNRPAASRASNPAPVGSMTISLKTTASIRLLIYVTASSVRAA